MARLYPSFRVRASMVLVLLAGCATAPERRAYDATANASIRQVAVLPIPESELDVLIVNNPGHSFGLVGALVAEANLAPKRGWLRDIAAAGELDPHAVFVSAFARHMEERGFELVLPASLDEQKSEPVRRKEHVRVAYPATGHADAQLDLSFQFLGYAAAGSSDSAPYRPTLYITARLMDAAGTVELFRDRLAYNDVFPWAAGSIVMNADPDFVYPDFKALEAANAEAVEGLRVALESAAAVLAQQFGRAGGPAPTAPAP